VYFAGFPGCDIDVSSQIEREYLIPVLGEGLPPENFNFGGISGGPMLSR